jgi:hypothetical protein
LTLLALALGLALLAVSARQGYDALWFMADLARIDMPLPDHRPAPLRSPLDGSLQGRLRAGDLYRPGAPARAGLVLVPGAAPGGRDDERLVEFAMTLARSGFLVLVPDIRSLRELQLRPGNRKEIAAALSYLAASAELPGGSPVGVGAFSVAVGPAVLAALEPGMAGQVDFMLLVGGYHDLPRTLRYLTTGYYQVDGRWLHREPNAYGKWVYALSNAQQLDDAADRTALEALARRKLNDPEAPVDDLLERLSPPAVAVYELIVNADPERVPGLIRQLPSSVRAEISQLDLAQQDLGRLEGRCILVHGLDDDIIPYTESLALAEALSGCRVKLHLLQGLYHVDHELSGLDTWRFWRLVTALLSQRH